MGILERWRMWGWEDCGRGGEYWGGGRGLKVKEAGKVEQVGEGGIGWGGGRGWEGGAG